MLVRKSIYHSHSVTEILDRITEYFAAMAEGRPYFGEGREQALEEAPVLDSCEAASVNS